MDEINDKLILACIRGELNTVKFLVSLNADISAEDNAAIKNASYCGRLNIVKFLLENKADISVNNN